MIQHKCNNVIRASPRIIKEKHTEHMGAHTDHTHIQQQPQTTYVYHSTHTHPKSRIMVQDSSPTRTCCSTSIQYYWMIPYQYVHSTQNDNHLTYGVTYRNMYEPTPKSHGDPTIPHTQPYTYQFLGGALS